MNRCVVISDSFKGTLSSLQICAIAERCIRSEFPACQVAALPVADGGEGTVDCFEAACGGTRVTLSVSGPFGEPVNADYLRLGNRAVVEMAACAGLPLAAGRPDPCRATTYGVGQLLRHAAEHGAGELILGLGGSATNDGGCGCAAALGVRFLDADGADFVPTGGTLERIARIDVSGSAELLRGVRLRVMCDIDNPLFGPHGAAFVFAPQKGADGETVARLDRGLRHLDAVFRRELGRSVAEVPGAGAAGGFGGGMLALFGAELCPGIDTVLELVEFDRRLRDCDLVLTGEGRLDSQSVRGKVVSGVARRAKALGVPVVALVGAVTEDAAEIYAAGVSAVFTINREAVDLSVSRGRSGENYAAALTDILRLLRAAETRWNARQTQE